MPSPNQLRYRIIIKNKKLRSSNEFSGNMGKAILQRTTTMDEPADNDEEYDCIIVYLRHMAEKTRL